MRVEGRPALSTVAARHGIHVDRRVTENRVPELVKRNANLSPAAAGRRLRKPPVELHQRICIQAGAIQTACRVFPPDVRQSHKFTRTLQ